MATLHKALGTRVDALLLRPQPARCAALTLRQRPSSHCQVSTMREPALLQQADIWPRVLETYERAQVSGAATQTQTQVRSPSALLWRALARLPLGDECSGSRERA